MNTPCPGPGQPHTRAPGKYLCRPCWNQLPPAARDTLNRRGPGAISRLRSLLDQLRNGTPPADIKIPN